ncbi:MAG: hypothetical protein LAT84_03060 [Balneolia bacterium]|nr:hypothetical protein [Balneolia bacterium]
MIGSSELLLTMGALIIFGLYAMQANRSMVTADTWSIENETQLEAAKIAEAVIHQAAALPFDRNVVNDPVQLNNGLPTNLTPADSMGIVFGQQNQRPNANFFDDFHDKEFTEEGIFGTYTVNTSVSYINALGEDVTSMQLRKRITVEVMNQNLNTPIRMRFIKSYH